MPEKAANPARPLHRDHHHNRASHMHRKQESRVRHAIPEANNQRPRKRQVAQHDFVDSPESFVGIQYFSHPASRYHASVYANPASSDVRASNPISAAARRVSQVQ